MLRRLNGTVLFFVVMVCAWETISFFVGTDKLPHLYAVISSIRTSLFHDAIIEAQGGGTAGYSSHLAATFLTMLLSLWIGTTAGAVLSLVCFQHPATRALHDSFVETFRVVPPLIFAPFALVFLGPTRGAIILIPAIYSFFSISVHAVNGLQNIPRNYLHLSRIYGSSKIQTMCKVQLPALLPELAGALRITSALNLGVVIVAEYLGAPAGIGRVFKFAISYNNLDLILVGIFWAVAIAVAMDALIVLVAKICLRWTTRESLGQAIDKMAT